MKHILFSIFTIFFLASATAQLDRSKVPAPGPAPEIKIGKMESFTLDNGMKVFVVENHKLPRVSFNLILDFDPIVEGNKAGAASMAGELIKTATATLTKDQIDQQIALTGATLVTSANNIYASGLKKHSDKLTELMSDIAMNAKFVQDEFDKLKKQNESALAAQKENPNNIMGRISDKVVYGEGHPYGENMTIESLANISMADCEQYYKTFFRPNISYLAIVGDITLDEAKALINKRFAAWQKGDIPKATYPKITNPGKNMVELVNRESSVQSVVKVVNPIELTPGSKDEIPAKVMNNILGGGASGRLFQNLREKHAYTYGAYSAISSDEIVAEFAASASVRNAVTDSAIIEILNEMTRIRNEEVPAELLTRTLNFMTGNFARSLENPQTIANFALNIARYNLPADYYTNYLKNLAAVTKEDVKRVANQYVLPQSTHIVVVGNAKDVAEKLKPLGEIVDYDVSGNKIPAKEVVVEPAPVAPVVNVTVEEVLNKYVIALGGMDNLKAVKDYNVSMLAQFNGMDLISNTYAKAPNIAKKEALSQAGANTRLYDGKKGTEKNRDGIRNIEGKELADLKFRAVMFAESKYKELGIKATVQGIDKVNGKDAYHLEVELPSGDMMQSYYDIETGLKVKESLKIPGMAGQFTSMNIYFSDYKEVGGVKFAHKVKQIIDTQSIDFVVQELKVNSGLKKKVFTLK